MGTTSISDQLKEMNNWIGPIVKHIRNVATATKLYVINAYSLPLGPIRAFISVY